MREMSKALDTAERLLRTCDQIASIVALGRESFEEDLRTRWAIEMGLIRLGEDVARLPEATRERCSDQPWRVIIAMRSLAAQQYDDLTSDRVWKTLPDDIPRLRDYLADVMLPGLRTLAAGGRREQQARRTSPTLAPCPPPTTPRPSTSPASARSPQVSSPISPTPCSVT